jgi:transcriptional regulator with XRE-family HTH domain
MTESDLRAIFGENLKRYRSIKGLSQAKLAEILDISPNFISEIETGKRWVSSDTLVNFAQVLGVEVYEFLKPPQVLEDKLSEFVKSYTGKAAAAASEAIGRSLAELSKQYIN